MPISVDFWQFDLCVAASVVLASVLEVLQAVYHFGRLVVSSDGRFRVDSVCWQSFLSCFCIGSIVKSASVFRGTPTCWRLSHRVGRGVQVLRTARLEISKAWALPTLVQYRLVLLGQGRPL